MRNGLPAPTRSEIVSSDDEPLILVDSSDRELGYLDKSACHDGEGRLHRAFSVFIFNPRGDVLLQRRSQSKRLWPSHWSNSCCSHPRKGETMEQAVRRRIRQELGFATADLEGLRQLYKFEYQARFGALGSEHELCSVYLARTAADPSVNSLEIEDWAWVSQGELSRRLAREPKRHTPWLRLEWSELLQNHRRELPPAAQQPAS